ncbi:TPA: hypothetical protein DCP13_00490 [Candidatus Azambacteria bacterium]|nr:hypothetical protein [Candidatus Azambacteria bacterium]HAQ05273.1 hypothetical protein [Candidatus Azambacteria bacterium]HBC59040.1 hypothetical protein [Candidatus Azambacteria bacterium]
MSGTPANAGTNSVGAKSEGAAEGGCGGNSAAPERNKTEASPAALLKTAKEPGEKHRLEPYFNFGGRKFFNPIRKPRKSPKIWTFSVELDFQARICYISNSKKSGYGSPIIAHFTIKTRR